MSRGPIVPFSQELFQTKYAWPGESFEDAIDRQAKGMADDSYHASQLNDILGNQRFMAGGRVQLAVGSGKDVTAHNCLAYSTKVITKEFGSVELGSLAGTEATFLDGNKQWTKAKVYAHGKQGLRVVSLTHGHKRIDIMATDGHEWIVCGKNVKTTDLRRNDRIDFLTHSKQIDVIEDYNRGVVHGLVYGDGSRTSNKVGFQYRVCSDHEDIVKYLKDYPVSYPSSFNGDPMYYFFGDNIWTDLKTLPRGSEHGIDYLLGFIRGWLAADGCVSNQPEVTLCGDMDEETWLRQWGEVAGFIVTGSSLLNEETNFGKRNKQSRNIRFDLRSIEANDILIRRKRERLVALNDTGWRVHSVSDQIDVEEVFCPFIPTTGSFMLAGGVHSKNCFVSGVIKDSLVNEEGCILDRVKEAAATMHLGGGIGYDFSTLRPRNSPIHGIGSFSSGPISFMDIFDATCGTISSVGHRRGAQMAVLRVDHPDILEFIDAKRNTNKLTNFNVSVGITDDFMVALETDSNYELKFNGTVYGTLNATEVWNKIMQSTWDWAEPGVVFLDRINSMNNLWYTERITTTNPCAEQPLPPYGACLLGSFNLVKYVRGSGALRSFDFGMLARDVEPVVRAMDNVVDRSRYPLPQQRDEAHAKRRMGLGVTGLANAIEALGQSYGSTQFLNTTRLILETIRDAAYSASVAIAYEKGTFPKYHPDYLQSKFVKTLPSDIQTDIARFGIRNSHLLSIAPTGTISLCADNISSGIEPVFAHSMSRIVRLGMETREEKIDDYGVRMFGVKGRTANEISADDHIAVLNVASQYVDSAVSKTCNVGDDVTFEHFKELYKVAYYGGAKGCTTFRSSGKRMGILKEDKTEEVSEGAACRIDPATGVRTCEA